MTISQALRKIAKLKGDLKVLLARAATSVTYPEGDTPAFEFKKSLEEADRVRAQLIELETGLRRTNARTVVKLGGAEATLTEATVRLQEHKGRIAWLASLSVFARSTKAIEEERWNDDFNKRQTVVKLHKCDLPEAERTALLKAEQDRFDELNDAVEYVIQRTNLIGAGGD